MDLIQISAWNDSGGGFLHRLLDGHPDLGCWPFELLLGRDGHAVDGFGEDWFRGRFRWPRFPAALVAARDGVALFNLVSDAELKEVLRNPRDAKHRNHPVDVDLSEWRWEAARRWAADGRFTPGSFVESYVESLLDLLGDRPGRGRPVLAHCPVAILDAPETWVDLPLTRFVCVIRSPLTGFVDMSRRHPGLDPVRYAAKWSLVNAASLYWAGKAPDRVKVVSLSQLLADREAVMRDLCGWLALRFDPAVLRPTWRGAPLSEHRMGPFGGIPDLSRERERRLAERLHDDVRAVLVGRTAAVAALWDWCDDLDPRRDASGGAGH